MTGHRVARMAAGIAAIAVAAAGCLPTPATVEARRTADLYTIFVAVAAVVAVIVIGLTLFAIVRYRRRGDDIDALPAQVHGSNRLEAVWTVLPLLTVGALFALTVGVLSASRFASGRAAVGADRGLPSSWRHSVRRETKSSHTWKPPRPTGRRRSQRRVPAIGLTKPA